MKLRLGNKQSFEGEDWRWSLKKFGVEIANKHRERLKSPTKTVSKSLSNSNSLIQLLWLIIFFHKERFVSSNFISLDIHLRSKCTFFVDPESPEINLLNYWLFEALKWDWRLKIEAFVDANSPRHLNQKRVLLSINLTQFNLNICWWAGIKSVDKDDWLADNISNTSQLASSP